MQLDKSVRQALELYESELRPFLVEHRVTSIDALDQTKEVLELALKRSAHLSVGFVGASQVGKSSIINALLKQRVVPAGGVGPLTAQATTIEYRDVNAIEVKYHGRDQLNRFRLALESYLRKRGELTASDPSDEVSETSEEASEDHDILFDLELANGEAAPEEVGGGTSSVGEHMFQQARLLLQRPEDPLPVARTIRELSRPTLVDAVRLMLEQPPRGSVEPLKPFEDRIREVRRHLGRSESIQEQEGQFAEFTAALRLRAALWMSPLVERLQLHLRQPLLRQLTFVDLPGVGNIADPGATVADEFIRRHDAGALVVVFRNNGLTEDVVEILDRAGVFTRLLWGGRGGRPPIRIILVVTHLDSVAQSRFDEIVSATGIEPDPHAIFDEVAAEMTDYVRNGLRLALESSHAYRDSSVSLADREAAIRAAVANSVDILCVDAKDYLQIIEKQRRGRFLDDEETTNIPKLRQVLREVAEVAARERDEALATAYREFLQSVREAMQLVGRIYEEGGGGAAVDAERFRVALEEASALIRRRMRENRRQVLKRLREEMPAHLDAISSEARENALSKLRALRRRGERLYWPSLNAAMRRGGVWEGKRLNYPGSLTRAFVDTIAASWTPTVIDQMQRWVRELADTETGLVGELCEAARRLDSGLVVDAQVEAQKKILQQQARSCVRWTDERLEELRGKLQGKLIDAVSAPIAAACKSAIARGKNRGRGASKAILRTFERAGTEAIEVATRETKELLKRHYLELLQELEAGYLRDDRDPVSAALAALTGEEVGRARAADHEARRRVLHQAGEFGEMLATLGGGVGA